MPTLQLNLHGPSWRTCELQPQPYQLCTSYCLELILTERLNGLSLFLFKFVNYNHCHCQIRPSDCLWLRHSDWLNGSLSLVLWPPFPNQQTRQTSYVSLYLTFCDICCYPFDIGFYILWQFYFIVTITFTDHKISCVVVWQLIQTNGTDWHRGKQVIAPFISAFAKSLFTICDIGFYSLLFSVLFVTRVFIDWWTEWNTGK